jgi:hypothetical protein
LSQIARLCAQVEEDADSAARCSHNDSAADGAEGAAPAAADPGGSAPLGPAADQSLRQEHRAGQGNERTSHVFHQQLQPLQAQARAMERAPAARAELAVVRARCTAFLQTSRKVGAEHLLAALGAGSGPAARSLRALAPERALLLSKLGRHEAALRLLLREMADMPAAEAYCARVSAGKGAMPVLFL